MAAPARPDEGVNVSTAAHIAGVSRPTLYRWIEDGRIPAGRFGPHGRIVRVWPEDVCRVAGVPYPPPEASEEA